MEEVEEAYQAVKATSILYNLLKPPSFLTKGFKENKKLQKNFSSIFGALHNHFCKFVCGGNFILR